jgi:hypothetical protein
MSTQTYTDKNGTKITYPHLSNRGNIACVILNREVHMVGFTENDSDAIVVNGVIRLFDDVVPDAHNASTMSMFFKDTYEYDHGIYKLSAQDEYAACKGSDLYDKRVLQIFNLMN